MGRLGFLVLALLGLAAMVLPRLRAQTAADQGARPDAPAPPPPPPGGQANPSPGTGETYWTPERLRGARPIEPPQAPAAPPPRDAPAPAPPSRGGTASPGSPGDGVVPPDRGNRLIPPRDQGGGGAPTHR